jgi:hypothetical protein
MLGGGNVWRPGRRRGKRFAVTGRKNGRNPEDFDQVRLTQVNAFFAISGMIWIAGSHPASERMHQPCPIGFAHFKETIMPMLKVIEVLAESDQNWENAAQSAVTQASESIREIKSIYIKDMEATVQNEKITKYRINAKISFLLEK